MKKLKLFANKGFVINKDPGVDRFIAAIWVDEKGDLQIEADTPEIGRGLREVIDQEWIKTPGAYMSPSRHEPGTFHPVTDPMFLDALRYEDGVWMKEYDGWNVHITASPIVDE